MTENTENLRSTYMKALKVDMMERMARALPRCDELAAQFGGTFIDPTFSSIKNQLEWIKQCLLENLEPTEEEAGQLNLGLLSLRFLKENDIDDAFANEISQVHYLFKNYIFAIHYMSR